MTLQESFGYLESFTNLERNLGNSMRPFRLDRMKILLEIFGNPQRSLRNIHVAGSKGKGSTAAFIASILSAAGWKTGVYASPHVSSYKERITLASHEVEDDVLIKNIKKIRSTLTSLSPDLLPGKADPTTFELLTILSYIVFQELSCVWAVIEAGIGGRLDATNVLEPEICVITPIEFEHTEVLGNTLDQIAFEKAGIIKPKTPVFVASQHADAEKVIHSKAQEQGAPFYSLSELCTKVTYDIQKGIPSVCMVWKENGSFTSAIGMPGEYQAENAALAALVSRFILEGQGKSQSQIRDFTRQGLSRAFLPGRMELMQENPPIVLDGAHTEVSVRKLLNSYIQMYGNRGILIFGAVRGKNVAAMARQLAPCFSHIIISTPGTFKESDPPGVYQEFRRHGEQVLLEVNPVDALETAKRLSRSSLPILVTGSFYMVSEIRALLIPGETAKTKRI